MQIIIVMNNNVCELYVLDNDVLQNVIECNYNEFKNETRQENVEHEIPVY